MKARITKRFVDATTPLPTADLKVYDDTLTGFGLLVYKSGKRAFFVEWGPAKRRRRMVIGAYGVLTVDAARSIAAAKLAEINAGGDPIAERERRARIPTWGEWVETYLAGVRRRKKQPRSDELFLERRSERPKKHGRRVRVDHPAATLAARWYALPVNELSRREVQEGMKLVAERGHTHANRWLASVRACLQEAVRDHVIESNPAMGIRQFREAPPRARVLSDEEFGRTVAAIHAVEDPHVRTALLLLMDTGARKSEVLHARWQDIDLDGGLWRIPSPKSGRPQVTPLTPETVALLRAAEQLGPWLVPGRDPSQPRSDLKDAWAAIRVQACLEGVTIHDLRRTFGLHVARKAGLHIASKLLRHSDIRVTERVYAPLGIDELRTAVADMQGARGKVIELQRAKEGMG